MAAVIVTLLIGVFACNIYIVANLYRRVKNLENNQRQLVKKIEVIGIPITDKDKLVESLTGGINVLE